mmetsp:Transcript_20773/g.52595  ORF Transcript_20773/g.52595 Transcript_20773/m.52595 type:complete len:210 (-) Transcript_20773:4-633(-)
MHGLEQRAPVVGDEVFLGRQSELAAELGECVVDLLLLIHDGHAAELGLHPLKHVCAFAGLTAQVAVAEDVGCDPGPVLHDLQFGVGHGHGVVLGSAQYDAELVQSGRFRLWHRIGHTGVNLSGHGEYTTQNATHHLSYDVGTTTMSQQLEEVVLIEDLPERRLQHGGCRLEPHPSKLTDSLSSWVLTTSLVGCCGCCLGVFFKFLQKTN